MKKQYTITNLTMGFDEKTVSNRIYLDVLAYGLRVKEKPKTELENYLIERVCG